MKRPNTLTHDLIAGAGLGLVVYGLHLAWPPLGWIAAGLGAILIATALAARPSGS